MVTLNDRQKYVLLHEHAREEEEKLLDVFNCVEQLHSADLHKALTIERGEYRFNKVPRLGKTPSRVLVSQLALALPRHVLGCLLSGQPAVPPDESTAELTACEILSSSCFDHVGKALTLLTSLCELAFHHRALREATLGQPAFAAQLTDAANMVLLAVTGPEAGACVGAAAEQERVQAALDRAAMVPAALRALAFAFTTAGRSGSGGDTAAAASAAADGVLDWQSICEALLQQPRGAMLLEAGFDAVRTLVLAVRAALVGDTQGEAVYRLAYYAGAAIELLSYMCVTPLFYQRLMLHDPSGAAPLRLVLGCLTLHDTPMAAPPFARSTQTASSSSASKLVAVQPPYCTEKGEGAAELLAARGFALLLMLSECEEPSFMDLVAQHAATRRLADHVNNRAAAYIGQVLLRPSTKHYPAAPGEAQMAINTLRAAELLSDDSNFRAGLIPLLAPTSAHLLSSDAESFACRWCGGSEAVSYHQSDDILINSVSTASLAAVRSYERAAAATFPGAPRGKSGRALRMGQQLALERAVLLAKLLVNLHVYVEGSCDPDLKDAFIRRMLQVLCSPPASAPQRLQATLRNLQQLAALLAPYGPPHAPLEQQLLSEIDMALLADLVARVAEALRQSMQPAQQQQPAVPAVAQQQAAQQEQPAQHQQQLPAQQPAVVGQPAQLQQPAPPAQQQQQPPPAQPVHQDQQQVEKEEGQQQQQKAEQEQQQEQPMEMAPPEEQQQAAVQPPGQQASPPAAQAEQPAGGAPKEEPQTLTVTVAGTAMDVDV